MSEVELIRQAAQRLRELASAATEGPWQVDGRFWHGCDRCEPGGPVGTSMVSAAPNRTGVLLAPPRDGDGRAAGNLTLAATLDPLAAVAVGRLLDEIAPSYRLPHPVAVRALELAYEVLGEQPEEAAADG